MICNNLERVKERELKFRERKIERDSYMGSPEEMKEKWFLEKDSKREKCRKIEIQNSEREVR